MSYRDVMISVGIALVVVAAALYAVRPSSAPLRTFQLHYDHDDYKIEADELRSNGMCSEFLKGGKVIVAVCGMHTVAEMVEN